MASRPPLPSQFANPNLKTTLDSGNLPPVKYQILNCRGQDILVGRMKIETPTPSGHAFILRRYDTGAVSLTTMFRAAFPTASEAEESTEVQWVKDTYDLSGTNGNSRETNITRLAGTWISPKLALELGEAYKLGDLINCVVEANPDPSANYRRSGKSATGANGPTTPKSPSTTTAKPSFVKAESPMAPNPPKRRKESSPVPAPAESTSSVEVKVEVKKEKSVTTPLRRSNRTTKSPAPGTGKPKSTSSTSSSPVTSRTSKRVTRRETKEEVTPSDETIVEEEDQLVEDVAGEELRQQDLAEQRVLIEDLKAQRDAALKESQTDESDNAVTKRAREDVEEEEKLKFNFKEPEVGERAIATNRRVPGYLERLPPERQGLAIGVAAFVFGVGAMFLPTLLS